MSVMSWSVLTMLLCSGRWLLLSSSSSWTSGEGLGAGGGVMSAGRESGLPIQLIELPARRHSLITASACVCVCSAGLRAAMLHLGGREPTYLFGSFIVWAVSSLINHRALWEVHWRIDPGFSVWTYRLSLYRQLHWQMLWLSDSWRALPWGSSPHTSWATQKPKAADTDCKTLMNAEAGACSWHMKRWSSVRAVNIAAGVSHPDRFSRHCVRDMFSFIPFELFFRASLIVAY